MPGLRKLFKKRELKSWYLQKILKELDRNPELMRLFGFKDRDQVVRLLYLAQELCDATNADSDDLGHLVSMVAGAKLTEIFDRPDATPKTIVEAYNFAAKSMLVVAKALVQQKKKDQKHAKPAVMPPSKTVH